MTAVPLSKTKIETKLAIIRESLSELQKLNRLSEKKFLGDHQNFVTSEHYLRRALEAVFEIGGHIISRYPYSPGKRPTQYKQIATALGDKGIIDQKFADEVLTKMAGYRNRMVHFYEEISDQELYEIIANQLDDIEYLAQAVVKVLEKPDRFDLEIGE